MDNNDIKNKLEAEIDEHYTKIYDLNEKLRKIEQAEFTEYKRKAKDVSEKLYAACKKSINEHNWIRVKMPDNSRIYALLSKIDRLNDQCGPLSIIFSICFTCKTYIFVTDDGSYYSIKTDCDDAFSIYSDNIEFDVVDTEVILNEVICKILPMEPVSSVPTTTVAV